jgi:hydrogenase-4 component B
MAYPSPAESELVYSTLPLWIVLLPLAGSIFVYRFGLRRPAWRDLSALLVAAATLALAVALYIKAGGGVVEMELKAGFLDPLLTFRVDRLSALLTLLSALIWFLATAFSLSYMRHETDQNRYYLFFLLSLGSCLGVFMTADLLSLFLFFEIMSFASYVLVVHARTEEALEAGRNYLYLGVLGGLLLLTAILLLYFYTGSVNLSPSLEAIEQMGSLRYLVALLLITGFGIKAGAVPLHIWLPKAHPVAPSPASALLSGIMIKTGAYGILRVVNLLFSPRYPEINSWHTTEQLGMVMIWVGIVTMFTAAFIALFQHNAKRILAYSSVSQMGYILMGVGAAAYLGSHGVMGLSGALYHIVNHAFFKAGMFMMVGAVYVRTHHQLDLRRLGGLWRAMPVTAFSFLIAAAGITGVPLLNGYTSKTLLHHAIVEAFEHHHLYSLHLAERIFTVTSALTVCYIIKLAHGIFFGERPAGLAKIEPETTGERLIFAFFSAAILFLGSFPSLVLNQVIIPATTGFGFYAGSVKYLGKLNFWDMHDLQAIAMVLALGAALYLILRPRFTRMQLPAWLSVERLLYLPAIRGTGTLFTGASRAVDTAVDRSYIYSPYVLRLFTLCGSMVDTAVDRSYVCLPDIFMPVYRGLEKFEETTLSGWGRGINHIVVYVREWVYNLWINAIKSVFGKFSRFLRDGFRTLFQIDNQPKGKKIFQIFGSSNLDFNLLIVVLTLILILGIAFFLR